MAWVDGPALGIAARAHAASSLGALNGAIVTGRADALQVGWVKEERQVAPVRVAVVDDGGGDHLADSKVSFA